MGELKDLREQSESLVNRAKELANKLYLAGLGAYDKAEEGSEELLSKYVEAGTEAFGEDAEGKPKALLAAAPCWLPVSCSIPRRKSARPSTRNWLKPARKSAARKPKKPTNSCWPAWVLLPLHAKKARNCSMNWFLPGKNVADSVSLILLYSPLGPDLGPFLLPAIYSNFTFSPSLSGIIPPCTARRTSARVW